MRPRIGYQNRPSLFARHIVLPEPLYTRVMEVDERIGADGEVLRELKLEQARADLSTAYEPDLPLGRHRLDARLPLQRPRAAAGGLGARDRLHPGLVQPRGLGPDQAGGPRRHHRRRRLSLADAAALRRPHSPPSWARGAPLAVHASRMASWWTHAPFAAEDAVLSGPAGRDRWDGRGPLPRPVSTG